MTRTPALRIAAMAPAAPGASDSRYSSARASTSAVVGRTIVRRSPYTDSSATSPRIARSVSAAIRAPTLPPRRAARKSIPSMPQRVESTSITTEPKAGTRLTREQVAGGEPCAGIQLTLDRAHHTQLHRRELERKPTTFDLPDAMLRGDGAA